jgi:hypothetical protein
MIKHTIKKHVEQLKGGLSNPRGRHILVSRFKI